MQTLPLLVQWYRGERPVGVRNLYKIRYKCTSITKRSPRVKQGHVSCVLLTVSPNKRLRRWQLQAYSVLCLGLYLLKKKSPWTLGWTPTLTSLRWREELWIVRRGFLSFKEPYENFSWYKWMYARVIMGLLWNPAWM